MEPLWGFWTSSNQRGVPIGVGIRQVESHAELSNHGNARAGRDRLYGGLGSGLGDGAEVVDKVGLGHTDGGETILTGRVNDTRIKTLPT